ncbi:MAG: HAD family hydrolase [Gammaproteobacteria bacterium]|nr:HAD family hydrolase [Gammaproteobacteria bacterium]
MKLSGIKLLTIDLDDTLWPCTPTILHAEQTSYNWLQIHKPNITQCFSPQDLLEKRKQLMREAPHLKHNLSEARRAHFRQLADECGYDHDWVDEGFRVFHAARQKVNLYEDVLPSLTLLRERFKLVALTNGNAEVSRVGLAEYFDLQISAADVEQGKPHPAMFIEAMTRLQMAPEQTVHIGDHAIHDVYGAHNAHIGSIWVNRSQQTWQETEFQADFEVSNLHQVVSLLVEE